MSLLAGLQPEPKQRQAPPTPVATQAELADIQKYVRVRTGDDNVVYVDRGLSEHDYERLVLSVQRALRLQAAVELACGIIEVGDQRLLASDGPASGPPDITLKEWERMYHALDTARKGYP